MWFEPRAGAARCGTHLPLTDVGRQSVAPALPPTTRASLRASLFFLSLRSLFCSFRVWTKCFLSSTVHSFSKVLDF